MIDRNTILGTKMRCMVTGFEGIAIGKSEWLNGCCQFGIKPPIDEKGKQLDAEWIDNGQLEFVDIGIADQMRAEAEDAEQPEQREARAPGGPQSDAPPI